MMTSKERMLAALNLLKPDRLPVTTHHVLPYYLNKYLDGGSSLDFFDRFGMDAITWIAPYKTNENLNDYIRPNDDGSIPAGYQCILNDNWRIEPENVPGQKHQTTRFKIITPKGKLEMVLQSNEHTSWIVERLIKNPQDIELLEYMTVPLCDVDSVNTIVQEFGQRGLVRGHIPCFEIYGQPGVWPEAACLVGIEALIMATYHDPQWVKALLSLLQRRKLAYIESLAGAKYDLLELGGGDASSTVISPKIFDEFVAPYDAPLIQSAHAAGQRITYHTCGGMMPFLERIADMKPDAMETFTPAAMGGDANLAEAKKRIGSRVCMIGGFDQFHYYVGCSQAQTRAEVRRCFEEAGEGGGFILSPSDHFFEAQPHLMEAFADEARQCRYD